MCVYINVDTHSEPVSVGIQLLGGEIMAGQQNKDGLLAEHLDSKQGEVERYSLDTAKHICNTYKFVNESSSRRHTTSKHHTPGLTSGYNLYTSCNSERSSQ